MVKMRARKGFCDMRWTLGARLALAALLVMALAGCGGGGQGDVSRQAIGKDVPANVSIPGMSVGVATDKSSYKAGDTVTITVTPANTSGSALTLRYMDGRPEWGYIIAQGGKVVAYKFGPSGLSYSQVIITTTYAAGESKAVTLAYPSSSSYPATALPAGTYQVYATPTDVLYVGQTLKNYQLAPVSSPVTFTVTR
ncbi:MAG: BsuPI-related putative proteinase inhibitor [Methanobacterium paludis]|nr:BsuPI-related putative proteinase inhibitor [Methanobacterium paludis]